MIKKTVLFQHDNPSYHKSMVTMVKFYEVWIVYPFAVFSGTVPSDYCLFIDLKWMLQGKRFRLNDEIIDGTNAYFEGKHKSCYEKVSKC